MTEEQAKTKWPIVGRYGWRSGHSKGYMRVKCPTHPNATTDGYVYEHVYRASVAMGRGLKNGEIVHHVDGNPANNSNANLLVCTHKYHLQLHSRLSSSQAWPEFASRKTTRPKCTVCCKPTIYGSKSGKCVEHYFDGVRNEKVRCRVSGCEGLSGMRSGLCLTHVKHRANKRRYFKGWEFHNG